MEVAIALAAVAICGVMIGGAYGQKLIDGYHRELREALARAAAAEAWQDARCEQNEELRRQLSAAQQRIKQLEINEQERIAGRG